MTSWNKLNNKNKSVSSSHQALLCDIQGRIEDANQGINAGNSILGKVTDALRLDWLRQLSSELKGLLTRSIAINIATYQAVVSNQANLPSRLERGLIEEPVILEDAIGRIAPVHLQFVTSWDAFDAILEIRFRGFQGHRKITPRQYGLQDRATGKEVEQLRAWQRAFLPGQPIVMSMLFHSEKPADSDSNSVTCPGCHTPAINSADADIHCTQCSMWYRRVTVVEESNPADATLSAQFRSTNRASSRTKRHLSSRRKRAVSDDLDEDDDAEDVREFKRVRIMSTPKCVARREDNNMINGTKLLNVVNVPRLRRYRIRYRILRSEKIHHIVKLAPSHPDVVWIPNDRALELGNEDL